MTTTICFVLMFDATHKYATESATGYKSISYLQGGPKK